jgi:hypothetical protein
VLSGPIEREENEPVGSTKGLSVKDLNSELGPEEWALLGFIHRHTHGGPQPPDPQSAAFAGCYAKLLSLRLIERSHRRATWVITDEGDRALLARYAG